MSEREDWINLIRNEYDPMPDLGKAAYPAFESAWDDGAGRIADAILADKAILERRHAEKLQWQPIETAPRDGSHILAYRLPIGIRFTNNTNPPTVVHWFDDPEQPGFYTSVNERAPEYPFNPTHWKPLDAPPQASPVASAERTPGK